MVFAYEPGMARAPRRAATLLSPLLAAALVWPGPAHAFAPPGAGEGPAATADASPDAPEPSEDPDAVEDEVARARELFGKGASRYETADYRGAIDLWTDAYDLVPAEPRFAEAKADLIYNIATAHEKAFAVDGEVASLQQAKILLEQYRAVLPDIYARGPEREFERTRVEEKLEGIARAIEAAAEAARQAEADASAKDPRAQARGLIIAGAVVTSVGVAGLGVSTAGLVMGARSNDLGGLDPDDLDGRRSQFDRGRRGNAMAIGGGIGAGVLVPVGAALLAVGLVRRSKLGDPEDGAARARFEAAPVLGRGHAGLHLRGRF